MTRSETILVIQMIYNAFPRFIEPSSWEPDIEKAVSNVVDLWTEMFADDNMDTVSAAVKQYVQTKRFPPTIADIREIVANMTLPKVTPGDIWEECYRLLNWDLSYEEAEKAYANMSDVCREATLAVGGWRVLAMSPEGDPYIRKAFMQAAAARIQRDRERGIPFDWSKVNKLVPRDNLPQLGGGNGG